MPAPTPDEQGPGGALLRLRDAVQALHAQAGNPSYRAIANNFKADDLKRIATASHNTVGDVLTCKRLTRRETLQLVVRQLHEDSADPRPFASVWPAYEELWFAADKERRHRTLPEPVQHFLTVLQDEVLAPLGDDTGALAARAGLSEDELKTLSDGTRLPEPHEVEALLALSDDDRPPLAPAVRRHLMVAYYDMLRACAPDRYADAMLREECEAQREYRRILEQMLHRDEQRRQQDAVRHAAQLDGLLTALHDAQTHAADQAAGARNRLGAAARRTERLERQLRRERWLKETARAHVRALQGLVGLLREHTRPAAGREQYVRVLQDRLAAAEREAAQARKAAADARSLLLDMRSERDASERKLAEQAALQEAATAVASAAEQLAAPVVPVLPQSPWNGTWDGPWDGTFDPSVRDLTTASSPDHGGHSWYHVPPTGHPGYEPYATAPPGPLQAPAAPPAPGDLSALDTSLTWHCGLSPLSEALDAPPMTVGPQPVVEPASPSKGLLRRLQSVFRSRAGRHARPRQT
ncbi:hypothetical protein [Streptomyces sp. NPDC049555]|uniref:hypothetical protein n=1 Tax=Streptomyces sp. NPDC049555 TaxID=3154930 RepID=UPI003441A59C